MSNMVPNRMTEPQVCSIDAGNLHPAWLDQAVEALARGQLVVAPTETRYGLLARADDSVAMDKLCRVKGRSNRRPVAVFVNEVPALSTHAEMTASSDVLASCFLPGPLTLVLRALSELDWPVVNEGWVGLRVSSSEVVQGLVASTQFPLSATSANRSGSVEAETIDEALDVFGDEVALYLDAGRLSGAVSTVVRCSGELVEILREGAVSRDDVMAALETAK